MSMIVAAKSLRWQGRDLCFRGEPVLRLVPDATYPGMWRLQYPDGTRTDMVNLTRARDAAKALALAVLNGEETALRAPGKRKPEAEATTLAG